MLTFRGNREPENVLACQRSLEISPVATQRMHGRTLQGLILICQCTHSSSMYIIRYFVPMGPLAFHNSCVQGQRSHTVTDIPAQFLLKKKMLALYVSSNHEYVEFLHFTGFMCTFLQ